MDFDLSPEQEGLLASVRGVLERECPLALTRQLVERGTVPAQPWQSATELHWPALAIPERHGGLGLSFVEVALVVEEHGRFLAPGPLLATVTQFAPLVREAGSEQQQSRFLGAVAAGDLTGALALADEDGRCLAADDSLTARPEGDGWLLDGSRHFVVDGDLADEIAVAARVESGDGVGLFAVPRSAVKTRRGTNLDGSRGLATLEFDRVTIGPDRVLGEPGCCADALARALDEAVAAQALEMVGTCQALFDRTLEYAKHREQFGRPIGSFQAIQHKLVDMFAALEKARSTGYFAALAIAAGDSRRPLAASMAKTSAGDCQRVVAQEAIQIHGGIGFSWEHDVHLFVKRAKSGEALLGTSAEHRARVADLLEI